MNKKKTNSILFKNIWEQEVPGVLLKISTHLILQNAYNVSNKYGLVTQILSCALASSWPVFVIESFSRRRRRLDKAGRSTVQGVTYFSQSGRAHVLAIRLCFY